MARAWTLAARPQGTPKHTDFAMTELPATPLGEGEVRVANRWLSVDPYMRGRMNDVKSYVPPFQIGQPMEGGAVGEVVESNAPDLAPKTWYGMPAYANADGKIVVFFQDAAKFSYDHATRCAPASRRRSPSSASCRRSGSIRRRSWASSACRG